MNNLFEDITEHFNPDCSDSSTQKTEENIPYWLVLLICKNNLICRSNCFPFYTPHLQNCLLCYLNRHNTTRSLFSFSESIIPLFPLVLPPPSFLTPLPPAPSSPRLAPNGGIPLQPPGRVLLFCSGGAHFMQYDYISLAAILGRISQSVLVLHKCMRNLIKSLHILPCSIYLPISRQLRTWYTMHVHPFGFTHSCSHIYTSKCGCKKMLIQYSRYSYTYAVVAVVLSAAHFVFNSTAMMSLV